MNPRSNGGVALELSAALMALASVWSLPAASMPSGVIARRAAMGLAAGGDHTCSIEYVGGVRCWGDNTYGQIGDNSTENRHVPVELPLRGVQVAAGLDFSCVLQKEGTAECWGHNQLGQLGDGTTDDHLTSTPLPTLQHIAAISAGAYHACALHSAGEVICWGNNTYGELGRGGSGGFSPAPAPVPALSSGVVALSMGYNHSCALKDDGSVWCWGRNADGQLGNGSNSDSSSPVRVALATKAAAIAAGAYHTCALSTHGVVYCWGDNAFGELGGGSLLPSSRNVPEPVVGLGGPVRLLASGGYHSCAVDGEGQTQCWGSNDWGELGNPSTAASEMPRPVPVLGLPDESRQLALGARHTCAVTAVGAVTCWGRGAEGQRGNASDKSGDVPDGVHGFAPLDAVAISSGSGLHTCAVTAQGGLTCWGKNQFGQLGDDTMATRYYPTTPFGLSAFGAVIAVAAGGSHSCALQQSGGDRIVTCWGHNASGQLGDGTTSDRARRGPVIGLADAVAVTAGANFTCALTGTGGVKCWGANGAGALGDGTGTDRTTPVSVSGIDTAVAVTAGYVHACAVLANGHVECWGSNYYGQLGDGTVIDRLAPVEVTGIASAVAVAAGADHSCALLADGSVDCWGHNGGGQLGNGTTDDSLVPVPVQQLGGTALAIDAGRLHTCAVMASGEVKCWGRNDDGQLGNFLTTRSLYPDRMEALSGAALSVAAGDIQTCVLMATGTIRCAGRNAEGELGTGEATDDMVYAVATSYQGQSADFVVPENLGPDTSIVLGGHTSVGRLLYFYSTTADICTITDDRVLTVHAATGSGVCGIVTDSSAGGDVIWPSTPLHWIRIGDRIFDDAFE